MTSRETLMTLCHVKDKFGHTTTSGTDVQNKGFKIEAHIDSYHGYTVAQIMVLEKGSAPHCQSSRRNHRPTFIFVSSCIVVLFSLPSCCCPC